MQTRLEQLKSKEKLLATKLDELKEWREDPERKEQIDEVLRLSDEISDLRTQPLYRRLSRDTQAFREKLEQPKIELRAIFERAKTLPLFTGFGRFWQRCLVTFFVLLGIFILAKWGRYRYNGYYENMQVISIVSLILIICCIVFVASLQWRLSFDRKMVKIKEEVKNLHNKLVSLTDADSLEKKTLEIEKALANHQKLIIPAPIKDGEVLLLKEKVSSLNTATNVAISQKTGEPFAFKICHPLVILIALVVITLLAICV